MFARLLKNKKAVLFDLDGTIIDSVGHWETAYINELLKVSTQEVSTSFVAHGAHGKGFWEQISKEEGVEKTVEELVNETNQEYLRLFQENQPQVIDGFWELLLELKQDKQLPIGMITNSDRSVVDPVLSAYALNENIFDFTIAGDEVKNRKPDSEMYRESAKRLNLDSNQILVFEDSIAGAQAAVNANMETVVIWNGRIPQSKYPIEVSAFITDFSGLPGNLDLTYEEHLKDSVEKAEQGLL